MEQGRLTMNQYICRVCKGNECTVLTSQGPPNCGCLHNSDIDALWEQDSSYQSERDKMLDELEKRITEEEPVFLFTILGYIKELRRAGEP